MKKICFEDPQEKKNIFKEEYELYDRNNHIEYIGFIYNNIDFSYNKIILTDIKKKFYSYRSQDKKKGKYDTDKHITISQLIHKLYDSRLKCYYCNIDLCLVYKNKKETSQWSLERFNNNIGHYDSNTCISCLKCNLQRRTDNHEYFKMGKQISIKKIV